MSCFSFQFHLYKAKMKNLESLKTSVTDDNSLTYPQEEDFKEQRCCT